MNNSEKKTQALRILFWLSLLLIWGSSFAIPAALSIRYIPPGVGPDEFSHLEYSFFLLRCPDQEFHLNESIYRPGTAPVAQGHQPPLSYWLGAKILRIFLRPEQVGAFFEYQAGIAYSSEGLGLGGTSPCLNRYDRSMTGTEVKTFRRAIIALRLFQCLLFTCSVMLASLLARLLYPKRPLLVLSFSLFLAAIPTALWRSSFYTNDNLVSTLGTLVFVIVALYVLRKEKHDYAIISVAAVISALAFLSKYNGIVALGMVFLGILLKPSLRAKQRITAFALPLFFFSLLVAPDLLENLRVDNELLSASHVQRVYPHLFFPSSLVVLLSDPQFFITIISRAWLNFHNLGVLDLSFPLWKAYVWRWLLAASLLGLAVFFLLPRVRKTLSPRVIILALASIFGAIGTIFYYAVNFPMPGGRYIHTTLLAFAVLANCGLFSLFLALFRKERLAESLTLTIMLGLCVLGQYTTFSYQSKKYGSCVSRSRYNVPEGADLAAADLDADGIDELVFFYRVSPRIFVARFRNGHFTIDPSWTRVVGLSGHRLLSGDIDGDSHADVLLWNEANHSFAIVDGKQFIAHNTSLAVSSEHAVRAEFLFYPRTGQALVGDLNNDGLDDPIVYEKTSPLWTAFLNRAGSGRFLREPNPKTLFGGARKMPFVFRKKDKIYLGTYDQKKGMIYLGPFPATKDKHSLQIEKGKRILTADLDGNGVDEILGWSPGNSCISMYTLDARWSLSTAKRLCIGSDISNRVLGPHSRLISVKTALGSRQDLLSFHNKTGEISLLQMGEDDSNFSVTSFDFGFSGLKRAAEFDY